MVNLTLISDISEWRCVCAATCSRPERTPFESSQSSPRQHVSLTSTTARRVFVNLAKSPCASLKGVILKPSTDCVNAPAIDCDGPGRGREAVVEIGEIG